MKNKTEVCIYGSLQGEIKHKYKSINSIVIKLVKILLFLK